METLIHIFTSVLKFLFFFGMAGSAIVVMITTIEDFKVFFEDEVPPPSPVQKTTAGSSP
jgi:hypothetical protein